MAGFDSAGQQQPEELDLVSKGQIRYGWALFLIYCVLYLGFVLMNAFAPNAMRQTPVAGVNLAVLLGLGLIAAAFVIALVYEWICYLIAARKSKQEDGR